MNSNIVTASPRPRKLVLFSASTAQIALDIGPTTFYKLVKLGMLTPIRFSKRLVRYRACEVDALIETLSGNRGGL